MMTATGPLLGTNLEGDSKAIYPQNYMRDDYKSRKNLLITGCRFNLFILSTILFAIAQILRVLSLYFAAGFRIYVMKLMTFNGKRELKRATSRDLITFGGKRELKRAASRN